MVDLMVPKVLRLAHYLVEGKERKTEELLVGVMVAWMANALEMQKVVSKVFVKVGLLG
jgi:hypothetical protein